LVRRFVLPIAETQLGRIARKDQLERPVESDGLTPALQTIVSLSMRRPLCSVKPHSSADATPSPVSTSMPVVDRIGELEQPDQVIAQQLGVKSV
jgi:hypothetical protein